MKTLILHRLNRWDGGDKEVPTPFYFADPDMAKEQKGKHDGLSQIQIIILEKGDTLEDAEAQNDAFLALKSMSPKARKALGFSEDLDKAFQEVQDRNTPSSE